MIVKRTFATCIFRYEELTVDRFIVDGLAAAKRGFYALRVLWLSYYFKIWHKSDYNQQDFAWN